MTAKEYLNLHFDEMVADVQNVVKFNTERGTAESGAPFGRGVRECLDYVLSNAEKMGFTTFNDDGYAGTVDFVGTGSEVVGILGHLDVVPAIANEWKYPPYSAEIHDGKIWGRGTMDDKGPMIACLWAINALKQTGFVPSKTVRLIFGCDEETSMGCVEHYFGHMPFPTISFSPDGDFPVIDREKGIYHFDIVCGKLPDGVTVSAGTRANVVPSKCTATLPDGTTIFETGLAAHGSTPDEGINAAHKVFKKLAEMYPQNESIAFVNEKLTDTTGKAWGVNLCDEPSGKLTCNLGVVRTESDGTLVVTIDIRFPVTYTCEQMYNLLRKQTPSEYKIVAGHISEPLYVPSDSKLVTTLMRVYNTETNSNLQSIAIGGGTYSRCLPNCVAFGPLFPDEEQTIHMPNECIILENLRSMANIYLQAIVELSK